MKKVRITFPLSDQWRCDAYFNVKRMCPGGSVRNHPGTVDCFVISTALHRPGFCHRPSGGSVPHGHLSHGLLRSAYLRNRFPSSFSAEGSQSRLLSFQPALPARNTREYRLKSRGPRLFRHPERISEASYSSRLLHTL